MPQPEITRLLLYIKVTTLLVSIGGVCDINCAQWVSVLAFSCKRNLSYSLVFSLSFFMEQYGHLMDSKYISVAIVSIFSMFPPHFLSGLQHFQFILSYINIYCFLACLVRRLKFVLSCSSSSFIFYLLPGFLLKFSFALSLCSKSFQFYFIS